MAEIFAPLSNRLYQHGSGTLVFWPFADKYDPDSYEAGFNLGDPDTFGISVTTTKSDRKGKNASAARKVHSFVTETDVAGTLTLMQMTDVARAISVAGEIGINSQDAASGQTLTVASGEAGFYSTGDIMISGVTSAGLTEGEDFAVDGPSGMIRIISAQVGPVEFTYDRAAVSNQFITGIASSAGLAGRLEFRGQNEQGVKSGLVLHNVVMTASGERSFLSTDGPGSISVSLEILPHPGKSAPYEYGYEVELVE
jgi:hypothetical protein